VASSPDPRSQLLSIRTALILALAAIVTGTVVALLLLDGHSPANVTLISLGTLGGSVKFFHWLIAGS